MHKTAAGTSPHQKGWDGPNRATHEGIHRRESRSGTCSTSEKGGRTCALGLWTVLEGRLEAALLHLLNEVAVELALALQVCTRRPRAPALLPEHLLGLLWRQRASGKHCQLSEQVFEVPRDAKTQQGRCAVGKADYEPGNAGRRVQQILSRHLIKVEASLAKANHRNRYATLPATTS